MATKVRMTNEDWDKLAGVSCSSCGKEILKTYGPFKQCYRCFYKRKDTWLEETKCQKCERVALKVTTLSEGLQTDKVICPNCGTYYP